MFVSFHNIIIDKAKQNRICNAQQGCRKTILKGQNVLTIREHFKRNWVEHFPKKNYCFDCAVKFLVRNISYIEELENKLISDDFKRK